MANWDETDSYGNTGSSSTPKALMSAGTVTSILGTYMSNMDKAVAESQNAAYYRDEANYTAQATFRQAQLTSQRYSYQIGLQTSAFAKGGVDVGSGSALHQIASTASNQVSELNAIQRKGQLDFDLAMSRAQRAQQQADTLGSPGYNLLQAGGKATTLLAMA